jgi:hypothetical protein
MFQSGSNARRGVPPSSRRRASEIWNTPQLRLPLVLGSTHSGSRNDAQRATATAVRGSSTNTSRIRRATLSGDQVAMLAFRA